MTQKKRKQQKRETKLKALNLTDHLDTIPEDGECYSGYVKYKF